MDLIARFKEQARQAKICVVFPEGHDERIVAAARRTAAEGWARVFVVGSASPAPGVEIINPDDPALAARYAEGYRRSRPDVAERVALRLVKPSLGTWTSWYLWKCMPRCAYADN